MRHPAQSATGGWVMPGPVFQWFPLCEVSVLIPPRVSFLLVWGLGVSAPTPKAHGSISLHRETETRQQCPPVIGKV